MGSSFPSLHYATSPKASFEVVLRRVEMADAPEYCAFRNDPAMHEMQLEDGQPPRQFDYTWEIASPLHIVFGVFFGPRLMAIYKFEYRSSHHVDCYVSVRKEGRGAPALQWARDVHKLLKDHMKLPNVVVSASVLECHKGSRWFCLKSGFTLCGVIPNAFLKNGRLWCKLLYCLEL